jgi:uncharacterized protein (DUF849 family)
LEDSPFIVCGKLAASDAEQVAKIRRIFEEPRLQGRDSGRGARNAWA